jgi:hypothetical protein
MATRAITTARFTRSQARFIGQTPGLDEATRAAVRQAVVSGSSVALRARQHEDLIRAVGRRVVTAICRQDDQSVRAYRMLESIIDALAPESVRRDGKRGGRQ